jgi:membrane fusion protein, multidrug efflux system
MSLPSRSSRWILYTVVALVFAGGVWWFAFRAEPKKQQSPFGSFRSRGNTQPTPVRAVPAKKEDLAVHLRAIGTAVPLNTVTVRSRVDGQLLRVAFEEGQFVKAGDLLAEIDPEPFKIRLAQVEANLRQNQAQLQNAKSDLERFKALSAQTLLTQQQLDTQQSLVAEREATVAASQAMVDDARRQLNYTKIEAPISGRLGLRHVDAGNLIRANDPSGFVVLTQTRPIAVSFTVPEIDLRKVIEPLRAGEQLEVEAWDRGEQTLLARGSVRNVDNQIDLATGTLRLKAEFPNDDEKLFPNQFVNIRLKVRTLKDAIVVPAQAVQYGSRGTYIYLINAEQKATIRDVVVGPADGNNQSIAKGVEPGEPVITEGIDRLREGRLVVAVEPEVEKKPGDQPKKKREGGEGEGKKGGKRKKEGT